MGYKRKVIETPEGYYTKQEAIDLLHSCLTTLRRFQAEGKIKMIVQDNRIFVRKDEVDKMAIEFEERRRIAFNQKDDKLSIKYFLNQPIKN